MTSDLMMLDPTTGEILAPGTLEARWATAQTFREFVDAAEKNRQQWIDTARLAKVRDAMVERASRIPGRWHLLVILEDWCGDAVNTVPFVEKLAELAPNLELRVIGRDANPDLIDAHLSGPDGTSRAIPVVMVLDERFAEVGWWGSRPSPLQQWVEREGSAMTKDERYRHVRTWYARDRGRTTLNEIVSLIERAAGIEPTDDASEAA